MLLLFDDNVSCEQAYFKMDNALIDDRRIHVDFSQSVSKLWSQHLRNGNQIGQGVGNKCCFKCGSIDHIAKECTGDLDAKQPSKYILKDYTFIRKGGNDSSRYDMVFDEETRANLERNRQSRKSEVDDNREKRKASHQPMDEVKQNDNRRKNFVDERNGKRKKHRGGDTCHTSRERRDYYTRDELYHKKTHDDRYGSRNDGKRRDSRREESYSRNSKH